MSEGYYPQNENSNFGAIVIVRKSPCRDCAGEELGRFKGSTLPNPYWYYKDSNGNALWKDGKIQPLFELLRYEAKDVDLSYWGLQSIEPILHLFNEEWPIIISGEYSINVLYSSKLGKALIVNNGKKVRTENPNYNKHYSYEADGIWVHKGISYSSGNKGSEGCLTIHPDDWKNFITKFPSKSEWETEGAVGMLWIFRLLGEGQEPPNPIPLKNNPPSIAPAVENIKPLSLTPVGHERLRSQ